MFKIILTISIVVSILAISIAYYNYTTITFSLKDQNNYTIFIDTNKKYAFSRKSNIYCCGNNIGLVDSIYFAGNFKRLKVSISSKFKIPVGSRFKARFGNLENGIEVLPSNSPSFYKPDHIFLCEDDSTYVRT